MTDMNSYQPMNCDLHDYLEIACMREYLLDVELIDGQRLILRALTTRTSDTKEEFIVFHENSNPPELRLDQLAAITPLDREAEFGRISFVESACRF